MFWESCGHGLGRQRWLARGVRGHLQLVHGVGAQPEVLRPERQLGGTGEVQQAQTRAEGLGLA